MLVLSRKVGEEILIDDTIRVIVLDVRGSQVRLGFIAPPHVTIQRDELLQRQLRLGSPKLAPCTA